MQDQAQDKTHLVLVNGVVFWGDRVLVSQRSWDEPHAPGAWTIPGGKVERTAGDVFRILEKTLQQEIREETGVEIEEQVSLVTNNTFIRSTGQHVIALVFRCTYASGEARPLEDTIACRWCTEQEIEEMTFAPNVKTYIQQAFRYV